MRATYRVGVPLGAALLVAGLAMVGLTAGQLRASDAGPPHPLSNGAGPPLATDGGVRQGDLEKAVAIAMREKLVEQLGGRSALTVRDAHPWEREDGGTLGVVFALTLERPVSGTYRFIVNRYEEGSPKRSPYRRYVIRMTVDRMERLDVAVDLNAERVAEMAPAEGTAIEIDEARGGSGRGQSEGSGDDEGRRVGEQGNAAPEGNRSDREEGGDRPERDDREQQSDRAGQGGRRQQSNRAGRDDREQQSDGGKAQAGAGKD